jgi:kinesin family member C2/C3
MADAGLRDQEGRASVVSKVSQASRVSNKSIFSQASSISKSLRHGLGFSFSKRGTTASVAMMVDLVPGDMCETLSLVTVREEEALESAVVNELSVGVTLEVLEIGDGRRIKIRAGSIEGWISSKTKLNEPLVAKRRPELEFAMDGFEIGCQHEVVSMVTVRASESLDSKVVGELKPGTIFTIKEIGDLNKRRAKIDTGLLQGWISLVTKQGELLVGKVSSKNPDRNGGGLFGVSTSKIKDMLEAARSGDLPSLKKVLEPQSGLMSRFSNRPNLNASDIRGKTALIYASSFGNREVVEYLLTKVKEIDVNAIDDTDKTALHHASKRPCADEGQAAIITMLLHAKAYLEARDHNGCTALMFAVANGSEAVARRLVQAQANVNAADYESHTCLDYAIQFNHPDLVQLLRKAGAVEIKDEEEEEDAPEDNDKADVEDLKSVASGTPTVASTEAPASDAASLAGSTTGEAPKKKVVKKKVTKVEKDGAAPEGEVEAAEAEAKGEGEAKKKKVKAKGEAKKKTTKKAAGERRLSSAGMMEAITAADESAAAVTVEEVATEEISEKQRALTKLKAVADTTNSAKELDDCIKAAENAGASEEDVAEAKTKLKALKAKSKARDALMSAMEDKNVPKLLEAIAKAKELGLPANDIAEAEKVLAVEKPKQEARDKLKAAEESGNANNLKAAIAEAKAAGLAASDLQPYTELLAGAESKEKAAEVLRSAVAERSVASLKFAIQQAKDAGIDKAQIAEAEAILKEEEPKQKAREQLAEAISSGKIDKLQAAIDAAKAAKLDASEYAEAAKTLENEKKKQALLSAVNAALEESQKADMKNVDSVRAAKEELNNAIQAPIKAGVAEADLAAAEARRKKLHNTVEDLKGAIRVFCRVRPLSKKEKEQGDHEITKAEGAMTLKVNEEKFTFDAVFTPGTQDEVFEDCKDLVQSACDGYNVTMFAYGQTGAGKTWTMYGIPGNEGTAPRTIGELFKVIDEGKERFNYHVTGSMLELYRNDLVDLLSKGDPGATKNKLNVRTDKNGYVFVEHLSAEECHCAEDLSALLKRGEKNRTVAATAMNSESSRSHLVLLIQIVSVNRETKEQLRGKILICDLAGSERLKKSQVTEDMQKEAIEINKSLTALGDVIEALTKGSKMIPYRNHKLTQLMQDSLGGTAKTLMFVNCSPANSNSDETIMSLKYAVRAKKITNKR